MELIIVMAVMYVIAFVALKVKKVKENAKAKKSPVQQEVFVPKLIEFKPVVMSKKIRDIIRNVEIDVMANDYRIKYLKNQYSSWIENCNNVNRMNGLKV